MCVLLVGGSKRVMEGMRKIECGIPRDQRMMISGYMYPENIRFNVIIKSVGFCKSRCFSSIKGRAL